MPGRRIHKKRAFSVSRWMCREVRSGDTVETRTVLDDALLLVNPLVSPPDVLSGGLSAHCSEDHRRACPEYSRRPWLRVHRQNRPGLWLQQHSRPGISLLTISVGLILTKLASSRLVKVGERGRGRDGMSAACAATNRNAPNGRQVTRTHFGGQPPARSVFLYSHRHVLY